MPAGTDVALLEVIKSQERKKRNDFSEGAVCYLWIESCLEIASVRIYKKPVQCQTLS